MLDHFSLSFLIGMGIVILTIIGVLFLTMALIMAYRSIRIATSFMHLTAFLILILPLLILENTLFLSHYLEDFAVPSDVGLWKFSVGLAALGISLYQMRSLDSINHYWRILFPLGLFTGTLIGAALSTLETESVGGQTRISYSSPLGAALVGACFFLITMTSVISVSIALNSYGSYYPEEVILASKFELFAATMLMLSSVILTLHRIFFPKIEPEDFFLLFVSFAFIAEAYSIFKNPLPIRIPADARALLFSLYSKKESQELSRIEVTEFSKESASLYSLALSGISGILTEITHSTDIDALIAGQTSHVIVSGRDPYIAFMITNGKNVSVPSTTLKYFLQSIIREGVSQATIEKYSKKLLYPLFHHSKHIMLHSLLIRNVVDKEKEERDETLLSRNNSQDT